MLYKKRKVNIIKNMKRYFGLSNREENLVVYNTFFGSLLNSLLAVPLFFFGFTVVKSEGLKSFALNYTNNAKV
jgi:hypothetical protein